MRVQIPQILYYSYLPSKVYTLFLLYLLSLYSNKILFLSILIFTFITSLINNKKYNKRLSINGRSTVFQTDDVGSNPTSRILRVIILIGKELSCHESLCRFEPDITRIFNLLGKVTIGRVRCLLNIVQLALGCSNQLFSVLMIYFLLWCIFRSNK